MSLLGLEKNAKSAKNIAMGLKNLRMGDLLEIPLEDGVERKKINDENSYGYDKYKKRNKKNE